MKLVMMFPFVLLAPAVLLALLTSGVPPMWILLPALALAALVAVGLGLERHFRGLAIMRTLFIVFSVTLLSVALAALAIDPTRPWLLWVVLAYALFVLLFGQRITSKLSVPSHP